MKTQQSDTSTNLDQFFQGAFDNPVQTAQQTINNPFVQYTANTLGTRFEKNILGFGDKVDGVINQVFSSQYRFYFDVDNSYVMKKILITLAPYLYRGDWHDSVAHAGEMHMGCTSPQDNVHAPDFYVPIMSMVTFVLLKCLAVALLGTDGLHPSMIVTAFWKCIVISMLEVIIVKIVFCFMDGGRIYTFDLISHLNYRYTTLCALVVVDMLFDGYFYYLGLGYVMICQCLFVYKTLQRYANSNNTSTLELNSFGQNIILILSLIQPFFSWVLLYFGNEARK